MITNTYHSFNKNELLNPVEDFRAAMRAAGLDYAGEIIADGQLKRFKAAGDHSENGWYILHLDGIPAGAFGCWKRGFKETWRADGTEPLTASERIEIERQRQHQQGERDQDRQRKHSNATARAQAILDHSKPATDLHPYLTRKGVKAAPGLRVGRWPQRNLSDCLLVPLRLMDGTLATLQAIFSHKPRDGRDKDFLKHGAKAGAHFTLGDPATAETLVIAEGYATAATIHEATGFCSVMAVDAGNLLPVALALRSAYPGKRIVLAADNDRATPGNPGLTKARAAAQAVGADLAYPEFSDDETGSDFNDLSELHGLDAVRTTIVAAGVLESEFTESESEPHAPAVTLCERSNFDADLRKLANAPAAAKWATAREIAKLYSWQCPWKRSYEALHQAISADLTESEARDIAALVAWLEQKARQAALDGTDIDARTLRKAGIEVSEVGSIAEALALVKAHPEALNLVKADLGTGKTSGILQPLADSTRETTIAITNRQSLVADLCSRLRLSRYDELQANEIESCTALAICSKSITNPKFAPVLGRADMVLVDEISAVVRECHEPHGVLGKGAKSNWEKFGVLLRNAKKGACGVDADLCTADVMALKDLMQQSRQILVIVARSTKTPLDIVVSSYDASQSDLLLAVERGETCRIVSDSANVIQKLSELIKKRFPTRNVMAIYAKGATATTGSPAVRAALSDINSAVHSMDVLLHTPAVESGVSLTVPHFKKTFGLYCGTTTPQAFIQMLRRDRTAKSATIAILGNGKRNDKTDCARILNDMADAHRRTVETSTYEGRYRIEIEPATPWDKRVVESRAAKHVKTNAYAANLCFLLEKIGATVRHRDNETDYNPEIVAEAKAEAADLAKAAERAAIEQAADISEREREEIERLYQASPDDCAAAERHDLKKTLALKEIDDAALDLWQEGKVRGQLERFESLTGAPLAGLAVDATEDAARIPLAARSNRLAEDEAKRVAFEAMGFDPRTGTGEITKATARETFINLKASPLRPVLENAGLLRLDRMPKYPVRWVSDFLSRFGLALEVAEQRGPRGERERVYQITQGETWDRAGRWMAAPGWQQMAAIAARRRKRQASCTDGSINIFLSACGHGDGSAKACAQMAL